MFLLLVITYKHYFNRKDLSIISMFPVYFFHQSNYKQLLRPLMYYIVSSFISSVVDFLYHLLLPIQVVIFSEDNYRYIT